MQAKQQFTHVHEQHTMAVHTADGIQQWLSSEAPVGLGLVVGLSGLDEPVVPPSVGVLPAGTAAALLLGVAEDRQLLRCRSRAVATSIVWRCDAHAHRSTIRPQRMQLHGMAVVEYMNT